MNELETCPKCGGFADNGFSRSIPPSPYFCRACMAQDEIEDLREQLAKAERQRDELLAAASTFIFEWDTCKSSGEWPVRQLGVLRAATEAARKEQK